MKRKERRIRFLLQLFFLLTGVMIFLFKGYPIVTDIDSTSELFQFNRGMLPVIELGIHLVTGLSCLVAAWALWANKVWDKGWGMFTFGLLLYGSLMALPDAINNNPIRIIPIAIIILIVLQGFSYMIRSSDRYLRR